MTVQQLFGLDQSVIDESAFEAAFGGMLEGVCPGYANECSHDMGGPLQIRIDTGLVATGGVFVEITALETITLAAADPALSRYDRVVVRRDNNTNTVWIGVKTGTPAAAPTPPALTRTGGIYEISLCRIYVGAGVLSPFDWDIVDERGEPALCGYMNFKAYELIDRELIEGFRQRGHWSAYCHATTPVGTLLWENVEAIDIASAVITDADGVALQQDTNNVADTDAYIALPIARQVHHRGLHTIAEFKFKLLHTSDIRFFVGLWYNAWQVVLADDPNGWGVGIQFSTNRGDTTWQFMCDTGAVQSVIDTGIAVDTDAHFVRVDCLEDESAIVVSLFNASHGVQASIVLTANLPPLANVMTPFCGFRTLAAAVKTIYQYYARGINRGI